MGKHKHIVLSVYFSGQYSTKVEQGEEQTPSPVMSKHRDDTPTVNHGYFNSRRRDWVGLTYRDAFVSSQHLSRSHVVSEWDGVDRQPRPPDTHPLFT